MATGQSEDSAARRRLFAAAFCAIIATSFCFVIRALVVNRWGVELSLSETQKGELLGVGLWPFAISIVLLSLVVDRIGFKAVFVFAAVCHIVGLAIIVTAHSYWPLYFGTLVTALGNGAAEAGANPLVATLYPDDKPRWLNRLHAAWPLGMIIGGIVALALGDDFAWRGKMMLIALPVAVYAGLLIRARFPASERVAAGVSYKAMLAEAGYVSAFIVSLLMMLEVGRIFELSGWQIVACTAAAALAFGWFARAPGRPLFILLILLMIPLATTELSTDSWISSLMEPEMTRLNLSAGWVLIYTSLIVFLVRLFAGSIIDRIGLVETLSVASLLAAAGLFLLSGASGMTILIAATLYGIGKSFFWGTTLALTSEQFPRGGAVTLNVMGGVGMLAAGIVG
jgi:MFS family permease